MAYNSEIHHRKSNRLSGYDYTQAGAYFVTICTQNRECFFGDIVDAKMVLNEAGRMVEWWYKKLADKFPDIQCGEFICMPNHTHFIVGADPCVRPDFNPVEQSYIKGEHLGSTLSEVVQWFKTMTTNAYIRGVKQSGWIPFSRRLWQRNYHDHIIRDETDLQRIREYIQTNPLRWDVDSLNGEPH